MRKKSFEGSSPTSRETGEGVEPAELADLPNLEDAIAPPAYSFGDSLTAAAAAVSGTFIPPVEPLEPVEPDEEPEPDERLETEPPPMLLLETLLPSRVPDEPDEPDEVAGGVPGVPV